MSVSRICTRCKKTVLDNAECPQCLAEFTTRRNVKDMNTAQRLQEFDSWFLSGSLPEISNSRVATRVAELVGKPVHPLDIATPQGRRSLRKQIVSD